MVEVLPEDDIVLVASAIAKTLSPVGSMGGTLVVVEEAPEVTSGRTPSILTASITGMSGSPSLAEGFVNHPLELESVGLSFEAPTPKGPTPAASPTKSSEMTK